MTIKKAIGIGLLGATIIGLVAFGIKTNSFNKENLKPKTLTRSNTAIRVNAEGEYTPISLNWLLNETLDNTSNVWSANFKSGLNGSYRKSSTSNINVTTDTTYTTIRLGYQHNFNYLCYGIDSSNFFGVYDTTQTNNKWRNSTQENQTGGEQTYSTNNARILRFETAPSGSLYTWLSNNATPYYNNNVVIRNTTNMIYQITKGTSYLENPSIINQNGTINIYCYAGLTSFYVNNTQVTQTDQTINVTNKDICIKAIGTPDTNTISFHLQIVYANTLPVIDPTPIPDPSNPVNEIIDIRGLMLQILTMPFTFITQAFDVTLWPNTQYEFNIGNFIMALISIASILFIIKLFTSGFSIIGNYTGSRTDTKLKKSQIEYNKAKTDLARRTDPNTKTTRIKKEK